MTKYYQVESYERKLLTCVVVAMYFLSGLLRISVGSFSPGHSSVISLITWQPSSGAAAVLKHYHLSPIIVYTNRIIPVITPKHVKKL